MVSVVTRFVRLFLRFRRKKNGLALRGAGGLAPWDSGGDEICFSIARHFQRWVRAGGFGQIDHVTVRHTIFSALRREDCNLWIQPQFLGKRLDAHFAIEHTIRALRQCHEDWRFADEFSIHVHDSR